ncbi:MAG: hypothetical protein KAI66_05255 [Lentisphaeria bacterium]|nr:hypothetical protein [Lentisphaeria bacterium]
MNTETDGWRRSVFVVVLACCCGCSSLMGPAAPPRYPISGYWFFGRGSRQAWREALTRAQAAGADTAIQFGPRPRLIDLDALAKQKAFKKAPELVTSAVAELAAVAPRAEIRRVLRYASQENFGAALIVHPAYERSVHVGETVLWRLVFPFDAAGNASDLDSATVVDLFFVIGSARDSVAMLLAEAGELEMQVFVGMPTAPQHPQYPWDPWGRVMPTFLRFSDRVLLDYAQRFGDSKAFVGVYQSVELPVAAKPLVAVLHCYRQQHALVRRRLVGKRIMVSPYWDARKRRPTGVTPASVREGIGHIARTDVDIIAPQDSRGTGKVGLFWKSQAGDPVAAGLRCVSGVGETTYGEAYHASTRDFYRVAREAVDALAKEGIKVELWANLEGFAPGKGVPCGSFTTTQRTTKERLDRQIMMAGTHPAKIISYMWDSYYTAKAGRSETLADAILAVPDRPIAVEAHREGERLVVVGYHLAGGDIEIRDGRRSLTIPSKARTTQALAQRTPGRYPEHMMQITAPWPAKAGDAYVQVRVKTDRGWSQPLVIGE